MGVFIVVTRATITAAAIDRRSCCAAPFSLSEIVSRPCTFGNSLQIGGLLHSHRWRRLALSEASPSSSAY